MKKYIWPLAALAAVLCTAAAWHWRHLLTAEAISRWSPEQAWAAAAFLLALYGIKSLVMCVPMAALTAAGGLLFPYPAALGVNLAGTALAQTLPFLLGRRGQGWWSALPERYPRLLPLRDTVRRDGGLVVFLLRLAGASPGDVVSLTLGASGISFFTYLTAGLLGAAPRVAASTLLGSALWDPWSGRFWRSLGLSAAVTVLSLTLWRLRRR